MSAEQDQARELAERIARRIASAGGGEAGARDVDAGAPSGDIAALRAGLADIQRRLTHIESHLSHDEPCDGATPPPARPSQPSSSQSSASSSSSSSSSPAQSTSSFESGASRPSWLSGTYVPAAVSHPSQERFQLDEAVSEIVDYFEREKVCTVEPGGKPCDHCAMCSSRGF
ncbi:MAG TPA: hypothetical protein VER32_11680 [Pyrinomonadaceae bacterium]|nr:hypothetical protein [Pyrinomonadaceae bacterium]